MLAEKKVKGYNRCSWLMIGKSFTCGRSCKDEYCKLHLSLICKGSTISQPCLRYGIGTQSVTVLYRYCGASDGIRYLSRMEAKARRLFPKVVDELWESASVVQCLPKFIGTQWLLVGRQIDLAHCFYFLFYIFLLEYYASHVYRFLWHILYQCNSEIWTSCKI